MKRVEGGAPPRPIRLNRLNRPIRPIPHVNP